MISYYAYPGLKGVDTMQNRHISTVLRSKTPDHILKTVCEYYEEDIKKVMGKDRRRELVWCRDVFYHFCRLYTKMTKVQIGQYMGGRDHTTVLHGERFVQDILDTEPEKIEELREIEYMILFVPTIGGKE